MEQGEYETEKTTECKQSACLDFVKDHYIIKKCMVVILVAITLFA